MTAHDDRLYPLSIFSPRKMNLPKRLIEVDLPIKCISEHARREKSIRHGHISTLHIWWARRPLDASRCSNATLKTCVTCWAKLAIASGAYSMLSLQ